MGAVPTVTGFHEDPLYPRIARAVSALLLESQLVAPVDVLLQMGLLKPGDLRDWRVGRVPYLEKVIDCNLTRLGRLLRILRMHLHERNLVPATTAYMRWGKARSGGCASRKQASHVEEAYARHFVWPGKGPFHLPRPRIDMSASVKDKYENSTDPIGMAWYLPEQLALLRKLSVEREKMSETWSEWDATASRKLAELRARRLDVRKVDVDVREVQAWCERRQRPIDGAARSELVAEQLRLRAQTG